MTCYFGQILMANKKINKYFLEYFAKVNLKLNIHMHNGIKQTVALHNGGGANPLISPTMKGGNIISALYYVITDLLHMYMTV